MTGRDDDVRRALESLPVPAEPAAFFDDLWERVQARELAAARRWRRVSVVLAVVALAAVASAAVLAASPHAATNVIDLRGRCASEVRGGLPVFDAHAEPGSRPAPGQSTTAKPPPGFSPEENVGLETGLDIRLFTLSSQFSGYSLDRRRCVAERSHIDLSHKGLAFVGSYSFGGYTSFSEHCIDVGHFAFRVRITTDTNGVPTLAELAVVRAKNGAPLIYIHWTPETLSGYASTRCRSASS